MAISTLLLASLIPGTDTTLKGDKAISTIANITDTLYMTPPKTAMELGGMMNGQRKFLV
jgi:hypothetical protein